MILKYNNENKRKYPFKIKDYLISISTVAILASYLSTVALLLTATLALFEIFLNVEGASHRWVSHA